MSLYHTCGRVMGLSAPDKSVLQELARRADVKNRSVVGQEAISKLTGLSLRQVSRSILSLKKMGWVCVEMRHRRDGRRGFNVYTITDPIAQYKALEAAKALPLIEHINRPHTDIKLTNKNAGGHVESFPFHARKRW